MIPGSAKPTTSAKSQHHAPAGHQRVRLDWRDEKTVGKHFPQSNSQQAEHTSFVSLIPAATSLSQLT